MRKIFYDENKAHKIMLHQLLILIDKSITILSLDLHLDLELTT